MKPTLLLPAITLLAALGQSALAQTPAPSGPASVPPPSAEQARSLEAQIHTWLQQFATQGEPVPARPVQFAPAGDHYRVTIPLQFKNIISPANSAVTLDAKMLDGTRWQLDNQRVTSPLTITFKTPIKDSPDEKNPSKNGFHEETIATTLNFGEATNTQVFDPTFSTPTEGHSRLASLDVTQTGTQTPITAHFGPITGDSTTTPVGNGHIDMQATGVGTGATVKGSTPNGETFQVDMGQIHAVTAISGFAYNSYIPLIRAFGAFGMATDKAKDHPNDPAAKTAMQTASRNVLAIAKDLLTGMRLDETIQDVKFDVGGHQGTLAKYEFAIDGEAPQDLLTGGLTLSMDGLALNDVPPPFTDYVPSHFAIHPTVSNLSISAFTKLMTDESEQGDASAAALADRAALFQHGGLNFGFDTLELAIAGANFTGNGKFVMTSEHDISGQAQLSATGLDALIAKAQANPTLQQGVPVVIFLKGIAHMNGDQAVWQISVAGKKVLINGVDLSAITGGMMHQ